MEQQSGEVRCIRHGRGSSIAAWWLKKQQGGAATMNPSRFRRWLTSKVMTRLSQPSSVKARHAKAERTRLKVGEPHEVHYFHQVDDGYSHLTAQLLMPLLTRYDIELRCHLVRADEHVGDNGLLPDGLLRLGEPLYVLPAKSASGGSKQPRFRSHLKDGQRIAWGSRMIPSHLHKPESTRKMLLRGNSPTATS